MTPTLTHYLDIVSDTPSASIYWIYIYILTFYLDEEEKATLAKSRDPHLAGGEQHFLWFSSFSPAFQTMDKPAGAWKLLWLCSCAPSHANLPRFKMMFPIFSHCKRMQKVETCRNEVFFHTKVTKDGGIHGFSMDFPLPAWIPEGYSVDPQLL